MASVSEQLAALNNADLSKLSAKVKALRKEIEDALKAEGKKGDETATASDISKAAKQAGVSVDEFMAALEWAKKMGLI